MIGYWRLAMTDDGLLRHDRHVAEGRLEERRKWREIQRGVPAVAGVRHHQAILARDDVALAQGRIVLDVNLCKPGCAVAAAARHDLGAIAEGVRQ